MNVPNSNLATTNNKTLKTTWTSTGIGAGLLGLSTLISEEHRTSFYILIPLVSPILSYLGLYLYYRFMEPPEIVAMRSKLKRDLKCKKKMLKDKFITEKEKEKIRKQYTDTYIFMSNLGQEEIKGNITPNTITVIEETTSRD